MSRRTKLYRRFKRDSSSETFDAILSRHRTARDITVDRKICSLPMKEEKAQRIVAALHRTKI